MQQDNCNILNGWIINLKTNRSPLVAFFLIESYINPWIYYLRYFALESTFRNQISSNHRKQNPTLYCLRPWKDNSVIQSGKLLHTIKVVTLFLKHPVLYLHLPITSKNILLVNIEQFALRHHAYHVEDASLINSSVSCHHSLFTFFYILCQEYLNG